MMEKKLTCVSCPIGCGITVRIEDNVITRIAGNRCPRGETYAQQEAIDPMRVLPTSVRVIGGELPLVSVKTDRPVPKRLILQIMNYVRTLSIEAPVKIGQVVAVHLPRTSASLVATREVHLAQQRTSRSLSVSKNAPRLRRAALPQQECGKGPTPVSS